MKALRVPKEEASHLVKEGGWEVVGEMVGEMVGGEEIEKSRKDLVFLV